MKTNELVDFIRSRGHIVSVDRFNINVSDFGLWFYVMGYHVEDTYISLAHDRCFRKCHTKVLNAVLEYLATPLKEREEETKYYLLFPDEFSTHPGNGDQWLLGKDTQGRYGEVSISTEYVQRMFTQKEIDEMPFDTNFFVKEKVK